MRKYLLIGALLSLAVVSCNDSKPEAVTETATMAAPGKEGAEAAPKYTKGAKMDPVCEMAWETGWTESTVYMDDTIRFCSEGCKMAFVARPEKYIAVAK